MFTISANGHSQMHHQIRILHISCAIKVDQYYDDNLFKICTYLSLITFTPEQLIKQSQLDNTPDENNNV